MSAIGRERRRDAHQNDFLCLAEAWECDGFNDVVSIEVRERYIGELIAYGHRQGGLVWFGDHPSAGMDGGDGWWAVEAE